MDVQGPTPRQNLKPNELSQIQAETHRIEASGRTIPPDHLQRSEVTERSRSPEVAQLAAQLRTIPEVRSEVIAAVEKKLNDGSYLTRESAEQTAAVLLNSEKEN